MDEKILIKAAKVIQRTANMLKGYGKTPGEPKEELLTESQEKTINNTSQEALCSVIP